ncbi:long-chain fatty acid--CoA ligase [bacterium]|nr:long-chain fatty acid--CoA ligase [bacterium]
MEDLSMMVRDRCQKDTEKTAFLFKEKDKWNGVTWGEVDTRVEQIAAGLIETGVHPGDRVAIIGNTRLEWTLCDLAIIRIGAVTVGIYQTLSGEQCKYILSDSAATVLFVEDQTQYYKIEPLLSELPGLKSIIFWDIEDGKGALSSLEDLAIKGKESITLNPNLVEQYESRIKPDDMALIIYTSGTTGPPKGACLSHKNILAELHLIERLIKKEDIGDIMMFFLPLSHVGERVPGQFMRISRGITAAYVKDINKILEDIEEIRPTFFGSVPRIFEKVYAKIQSEVANASASKQKVFTWAEKTGREYSKLVQLNRPIPFFLQLKYKIADKLVFHKIRQIFGGRVRYFLSSSAPIAQEIIEFFHACGMLILEAYGQTEVSCFCTLCTPDAYRFGSVGRVLPETEIKIANDGEILVKGDIVFKGYLNQSELTEKTLTSDGWIYTGDVGKIDEDGYLWITGRKKEIIVTSGGKNVTPSNIEHLLMNHPLVELAMVHGDRRNFLTALISLSPENILIWGENNGYPDLDYSEYTRLEAVIAEVQKIVDQANSKLARFETIKKFAILPQSLQVETGELTPTMKIRRKIVEDKYRPLLDAFYTAG